MPKRFVLIAGITIIVLVVGYFTLSFYSVRFLRSKIHESLGPGISFTQINATTRYIGAKRIIIEEPQSKLKLLEADEIRIYPAIRSFLTRSIILKDIVFYHPSIYIYRTKDGVIIGPGLNKTEKKQTQRDGNQQFNISLNKITVKQGSLLFTDNRDLSPAATIHLIEIESNIRNIKYPFTENRSPLTLKGKLSNEDKGNLKINGWFNIKSNDSHLKTSLDEADVTKFKPYYKKEIGDIVEKGFANISSNIDIQKSIADISGKLHLFDLHINETSGKQLGISAKDIFKIVRSKKNQLDAQFHAKGNLKDPNFNLGKELTESIITDLSKSSGLSLKNRSVDTLKDRIEREKEKIKDKIDKLF